MLYTTRAYCWWTVQVATFRVKWWVDGVNLWARCKYAYAIRDCINAQNPNFVKSKEIE